jgi:hypothetical protein
MLLTRLLLGQDTGSLNSIEGSVKYNPSNIDGSSTLTLFSKIDVNVDNQEDKGQPLIGNHDSWPYFVKPMVVKTFINPIK